ncbi:MAG TPA: fibronectin type III domain-containing protein [Solirubrobacteraceae bacterium]|nr:fibronectin type III domain-containing protein [Solirubrobacteraceae bacterium]
MPYRRCGVVVGLVLAVAFISAGPALATGEPDLAISVKGPMNVGVKTPFATNVTVTNDGTAATPGITVSFSTGTHAVSPTPVAGWSCLPIQYGHSGRGGGVTTVGESCSSTLATPLAPGQSTSVAMTMAFPSAGTYGVTFTAVPYPSTPELNLVAHSVTSTIGVVIPPAPAPPTGVTATQVGDWLWVTWTPDPATQNYLTSSTITATPTGGSTAPVLTQVVSGLSPQGGVFGVTAATQYAVTVVSNDFSGSSAPSAAATLTTAPATLVPRAPTIGYIWIAGSTLAVRMIAPRPGNSAIDEYEVLALGATTVASYVTVGYPIPPGSNVYDYTTLDPALTWQIRVRAHNAAGWGPWSPASLWDGTGG